MFNRIFSSLNRFVIYYLNGQILVPALSVLMIIALSIVYVRLVNSQDVFTHAGYSRARILSSTVMPSQYSLPSVHMSIVLQNEERLQIVASNVGMNTSGREITCVEFKQNEGGDRRIVTLVSSHRCEQLPPWSPVDSSNVTHQQ